MICTALDTQQNRFSLSGECPHCAIASVFMIVAGPHTEPWDPPLGNSHLSRHCAAMQCQGCRRFILGIVKREQQGGGMVVYSYLEHYPFGIPRDGVSQEIPTHIGADFREALRCRFVDAHNATVEMCRRAVQASCIQLKAPADDKLVNQIDWLAKNGIITTPLKEMAHRVRLGGNLGAHPPEDPEDPGEIIIGAEYSDAVIEFTRDFFQHVYVMPKRLESFTFKKITQPQSQT